MAQENLSDVIDKRFGDSLSCFLKLVDPERKYPTGLELSKAWSRLPLTDQRKLYLYLLYRKWRGIDIYGEPYFIIMNCHPVPFNWNGYCGINSLMKEKKMVIAKYQGSFGTFTYLEAKLYEMTDIKALNFIPKECIF